MRIKAAVVGLAWMLVTGVAEGGPVRLGVMGGAGRPEGDFVGDAETGWNVGGTATWMFRKRLGLGADVAYHAWDGSNPTKAEAAGGPGSEFQFSALQATAHIVRVFPTGGSLEPWLKLGLGVYKMNTRVEGGQVESDNRKEGFGLNLGIGADWIAASGWRTGVGLVFHQFQRLKVPKPTGGGPGGPFGYVDTGPDEATSVLSLNVHVAWGSAGERSSE